MAKSSKTKTKTKTVADLLDSGALDGDEVRAAFAKGAGDYAERPALEVLEESRLLEMRRWREQNPIPSMEFDAFGVTWDLPSRPSAALQAWVGDRDGASFANLSAEEAQRFVELTVPADVLAAWAEVATSEELGAATLRYFLAMAASMKAA